MPRRSRQEGEEIQLDPRLRMRLEQKKALPHMKYACLLEKETQLKGIFF